MAAGNRNVVLIAANESQHTILARPEKAGGYGLDALWTDLASADNDFRFAGLQTCA